MKALVTLAAVAEALGIEKRSAERRADREAWPYTEETVRGGRRRLYDPAMLPKSAEDVRRALTAHKLTTALADVSCAAGSSLPAALPAGAVSINTSAVPAVLSCGDMSEADRTQRDAAQAVIRAVDKIIADAGCSPKAACHTLIINARAGQLTAAMVRTLKLARDGRGRPSADGLPSPRSLLRWMQEKNDGGDLAPRVPRKDMAVLLWYPLAIALKQRPQKPTTKWVHEQIVAQWDVAWGAQAPSYDVVYRFFRDKFSQLEQLKGQHLGSSLRAHMFYQHRTAHGLAPFVEVHADGWNTHFTAPHPVTGEFVTYEVWHFRDVATRFVTPPSIGLSESFEVIAKGLENCIRVGGVPAVWQTDSTGSVKNDRMKLDPVTSIAERGGITIVHPQEVGNSQVNGICENFNTYLDRESRELATYHGKHMDSLALKRVKKLTEKLVKAARAGDLAARDQAKREAERAGKGLVFDSRDHAVAWIHSKIDKFNDTPHSSLPQITDPMTGKRRHQSPREALAEARAAGWQPVLMDEASLVDLFRPHVRKTVRRGCVSPFGGQRYHHAELPHWEGKEVQVAIDIMDWQTVWVKDLDGRVICEAAFVEATGYRAQSMYEYALDKRARAQVKRKETQIAQIEGRMAAPALEAPAAPAIDIAMQLYGDEVTAPTLPAFAAPQGGADELGAARRSSGIEVMTEAAPGALPELLPIPARAEKVTPAKKAEPRYDDITDLALYLYGDALDEKEGRDQGPDFEVAAG